MKTLLTALIAIATMTAAAQTSYYIVPADSVAAWTPLMAQSLGHNNLNIRCDTAGVQCLMKFTAALAPAGAGIAYTPEQLRAILNTQEWGAPAPEPVDSEVRVREARARGEELTQIFFAAIDQNHYDGTWTRAQAAAVYTNYEAMFALIREGLFNLVIDLYNNGNINPQGVITAGMLNALMAKLQSFEDGYPRP